MDNIRGQKLDMDKLNEIVGGSIIDSIGQNIKCASNNHDWGMEEYKNGSGFTCCLTWKCYNCGAIKYEKVDYDAGTREIISESEAMTFGVE